MDATGWLYEIVKFGALFGAAVLICFVFPFVMMFCFRVMFLGNPEKLRTIKKYRELPRK